MNSKISEIPDNTQTGKLFFDVQRLFKDLSDSAIRQKINMPHKEFNLPSGRILSILLAVGFSNTTIYPKIKKSGVFLKLWSKGFTN